MQIESKLQNIIKGLPLVLANQAVNWSLDNFKKQGYQGGSGLEAWAPVKSKKRAGRNILTKTARLKRSIQVIPTNGGYGFGSMGVPYARIHNEGGTISQAARSNNYVQGRHKNGVKKGRFKKGVTVGRGFTFGKRAIPIPKRQFIGASPALRKQLIETARQYIKSRL